MLKVLRAVVVDELVKAETIMPIVDAVLDLRYFDLDREMDDWQITRDDCREMVADKMLTDKEKAPAKELLGVMAKYRIDLIVN